jgi:hypothetical protein
MACTRLLSHMAEALRAWRDRRRAATIDRLIVEAYRRRPQSDVRADAAARDIITAEPWSFAAKRGGSRARRHRVGQGVS